MKPGCRFMNSASFRQASRKVGSSGLIEHEDVHQHDGRGVDRKLTFDRESVFCSGRNGDMRRSIRFGNMMPICYDRAITELTLSCQYHSMVKQMRKVKRTPAGDALTDLYV